MLFEAQTFIRKIENWAKSINYLDEIICRQVLAEANIRKIGNFDVRARAKRTPKGKARTIVKKKIISVMAKPPMKKSPGTFAVEGVFIAVISQQSITIVPIHTLVYLMRAGF